MRNLSRFSLMSSKGKTVEVPFIAPKYKHTLTSLINEETCLLFFNFFPPSLLDYFSTYVCVCFFLYLSTLLVYSNLHCYLRDESTYTDMMKFQPSTLGWKKSRVSKKFRIAIGALNGTYTRVSNVVEFPGARLGRLRTINSELNGAT